MLSQDGEYAGVEGRGREEERDKVVQFERFGFVRIDGVGGDGVVAYFYAQVRGLITHCKAIILINPILS